MQKEFLGCFILAALALTAADVWAMKVEDVTNPRRSNVWVSDHAQMIDPQIEAKLNQLLEEAHQLLTVEIAVVTVDKVDAPTPKDFATELFNHWGIGHRKTNNGLLILMVKDVRRLEMETGYGLESVLTDGWLKRMQEGEMVPRFKRGEFGQGIYRGAELSVNRIRDHKDGVLSDDSYDNDIEIDFLSVFLWVSFFGGFVGFVGGTKIWKHRKDRTCPKCRKRMEMLPEDEDDVHLTPGQLKEEQIGSVDWQYWYCLECQESRLLRVGKYLTGYSKCRACQYMTQSVDTRTIYPATYSSSGKAEVTENCAHCGRNHTYYRTIPQKQHSSGSSGGFGGGGGGSFGGGSSGGGGSGSSW